MWFFRDPDHSKALQNPSLLTSPVYGRIAYIKKIENARVECNKKGETIAISDITKEDWPENDAGDGWLIGIAMTALDVHYQYAPTAGEIRSIKHFQHGRNLPMFDLWEYVKITWFRKGVQLFSKKYVIENERQTMWLERPGLKLALVLIADKFVHKITTYVEAGQSVRAGEKLSFIGRGSQVDVVICGHPNLELKIAEGQAVYGPLTALARLQPQAQREEHTSAMAAVE